MKLLSRVRLLATPWTAAHQAPPSMGFSRQEYWSGVPYLFALTGLNMVSLLVCGFTPTYLDMYLFLGAPKLLQMVTAAMKLKDTCSLEEKL